jgi:hypothetical protein
LPLAELGDLMALNAGTFIRTVLDNSDLRDRVPYNEYYYSVCKRFPGSLILSHCIIIIIIIIIIGGAVLSP